MKSPAGWRSARAWLTSVRWPATARLLVSPFVLDRVQHGPASAPRLDPWVTTQVSERGAPQTAVILQRTRLGSFAEAYGLVHDELTEPEYRSARVHLQELLTERAASVARQEVLEGREVRRLFANGSVVVRVLVLGLMQGMAAEQAGLDPGTDRWHLAQEVLRLPLA